MFSSHFLHRTPWLTFRRQRPLQPPNFNSVRPMHPGHRENCHLEGRPSRTTACATGGREGGRCLFHPTKSLTGVEFFPSILFINIASAGDVASVKVKGTWTRLELGPELALHVNACHRRCCHTDVGFRKCWYWIVCSQTTSRTQDKWNEKIECRKLTSLAY